MIASAASTIEPRESKDADTHFTAAFLELERAKRSQVVRATSHLHYIPDMTDLPSAVMANVPRIGRRTRQHDGAAGAHTLVEKSYYKLRGRPYDQACKRGPRSSSHVTTLYDIERIGFSNRTIATTHKTRSTSTPHSRPKTGSGT